MSACLLRKRLPHVRHFSGSSSTDTGTGFEGDGAVDFGTSGATTVGFGGDGLEEEATGGTECEVDA